MRDTPHTKGRFKQIVVRGGEKWVWVGFGSQIRVYHVEVTSALLAPPIVRS